MPHYLTESEKKEIEAEFDKKFVTLDEEGVKVVKPENDTDDGGTSLWQDYPLKKFLFSTIENILERRRVGEILAKQVDEAIKAPLSEDMEWETADWYDSFLMKLIYNGFENFKEDREPTRWNIDGSKLATFIHKVVSSQRTQLQREIKEAIGKIPVNLVDVRFNPDDKLDYKQAVLLSQVLELKELNK